ncbi:MAG TPA: malonic semialdehyde reductase [Trebonia sp.]|nr:malonic semialdehyde reductase [Trebonia sp.]
MTAEVTAYPALGRLDDAARAALFTSARTASSWTGTPVTDDELASIWELAKWAPTSSNIQPLRVLYVRPGEGRSRLITHMSDGNKAKTLAAPAVAVLAVDTRFHEHIPAVWPHRPELKDTYEASGAMRENGGKLNAALQAGYFILAIRAHGLAAGPMTGFDPAGVDAEFFPDGRRKSFLVVNIGHPGENAWRHRLPRLDHEDVISWA